MVNNFNSVPVYFAFEYDFVEDGIRCIPMIVRFKLDACGIKLKLKEWSKMSPGERHQLAERDCHGTLNTLLYRSFLQVLVLKCTGAEATEMETDEAPAWADTSKLHPLLVERLSEYGWHCSLHKWKALSDLQRFVLLKLCRPGHESSNFPKAFFEFGLM